MLQSIHKKVDRRRGMSKEGVDVTNVNKRMESPVHHSNRLRSAWIFQLLLSFGLAPPIAHAVPSFARQTGMPCEACHTVFPELTHFGRVFKANGYTLTNLKQVSDVNGKKEQLLELSQLPPLSIMAQISYTELKTPVPNLASAGAPGVAQNGTVGFPQQFSLFYAGKIAPDFGAMFQLTYDSAGGTIGIDNSDL